MPIMQIVNTPVVESLETLLTQWSDGDTAAGERVLALAYSELRRVAAMHFRHERPGHTLQPTALVHEVFMRLSHGRPIHWQNQTHFLRVFSRKVRRLLVDHARRRKAQKRRNTNISLDLAREVRRSGPQYENLLTIDRLLQELERLDERAAQVVEHRVFGGLTDAEISEVLGISIATVKRDWSFARAWLHTRLQ
jgi:RNA polymerase sigma factor (TIGR02999 family)